jgi:hypothetical protein
MSLEFNLILLAHDCLFQKGPGVALA